MTLIAGFAMAMIEKMNFYYFGFAMMLDTYLITKIIERIYLC